MLRVQVFSIFMLLLFVGVPVRAQLVTSWIGKDQAQWTTTANWSNGVPNSRMAASIPTGDVIASRGSNPAALSLALGIGSTKTNSNAVLQVVGADLALGNRLTIGESQGNGSVSGNLIITQIGDSGGNLSVGEVQIGAARRLGRIATGRASIGGHVFA